MQDNQKVTIDKILNKKQSGEKIVMLTAYDYPFARITDKAGADIILVGDSLANVALGLDSTLEVGMNEMIHHAKAVRRGVFNAFLVGDMPFEAYQVNPGNAIDNAKRFINDAGCQAIKLEWFDNCLDVTEEIVNEGIEVMGHVGLTPQTAQKLGGFKVQGKDAQSASEIILRAKELEKRGCFSVVLECVPEDLAKIITEELNIPTIGIGAGRFCDGQVLVTQDLLGLYDRMKPKFVKQYGDLNNVALQALLKFKDEVEKGIFPSDQNIFKINPEELKKIGVDKLQ